MPRGLKPNLAPEEKKKSRNHARLKEIETEIINAKEDPREARMRFTLDLLIGRRRELADGRAPIRFEDLRKPPYRSIGMIKEALKAQKQRGVSREEAMLPVIRSLAEHVFMLERLNLTFLPHGKREVALIDDKLRKATDSIRYEITRFAERRLHREIVLPYWPRRKHLCELPTPRFEDLSKPRYRSIGMIKDALKAQKRYGYSREETLLLIVRDYVELLLLDRMVDARVEPHLPPLKLLNIQPEPLFAHMLDEPDEPPIS